MLGFPAVTIRNSMERPEAIDAGSIILTGLDPDIVLDSVKVAIDEHSLDSPVAAKRSEDGSLFTDNPSLNSHHASHFTPNSLPDNYNVENTSWRVLKVILGTARLSNTWWGIN
jgi:UDP-N-acetylglucosamine 2-epimerase (non-hydrolysing)